MDTDPVSRTVDYSAAVMGDTRHMSALVSCASDELVLVCFSELVAI